MVDAAPQSWIQKYYPSFDGFRALAVLAVFFCHYGPIGSRHLHEFGLWVGVDFFFVLSGFLITGILYDSRSSERYFKDFYIRRSLRILPLPYTFFLLVFLLTPLLHLKYSWYVLANPLYISNLLTRSTILGLHGNPTVIDVGHGLNLGLGTLWSLCVEEQFYLVWPLAVWLFPSRKILMRLCVAGVLLSAGLRAGMYFHDPVVASYANYLYVSTFTRADTLLIGGWLALWLRGTSLSRASLHRSASTLLWPSLGVLAVLLITVGRKYPMSELNPVMQTVGYTLTALAAAGVLLLALDSEWPVGRWVRHPWLSALGRISYGFYFFHDLPESLFRRLVQVKLAPHHLNLLVLPLALLYSILAAYLSFRFLESPFLRLKQRWAPGHATIPAGTEAEVEPLLPSVAR